MTVPSNGVAPPYATPTSGWPAGPQTWETKNTGAMSRMGIVLEEVTPPHVTPQGVAPQYAPPIENTGELSGRDILLKEFPSSHVNPHGVATPYAPQTGDIARAVQLSVAATAVRTFLLSNTSIDGDLIDDIIQKGGVRDLADFKHLKEEDFTDPAHSIIFPRVIPRVQARLLIQESIPKLFPPTSHVRIDLVSSHAAMIHERHALVNDEHVPHGLSPLSHAHGTSTDPPGVSPTMSRGGTQALSPTEPQQQQSSTPGGTCNNCARQDASVVLRCVSPTQPLWLCQSCSNLVELGRSLRNTSSSGSDGSQGGSVSTRSSWNSALDSEGRQDGFQAPPPHLRSADLDRSLSATRHSAQLAGIQKQAPVLPVDKNGRIQLHGSTFEHYMDLIPSLAMQFDALSGAYEGAGTCMEGVLRFSKMHPRILSDRVPEMQRARESPVDKELFQILQPGLKDVWSDIPMDIRSGRSAIALYRYFVSLKPRNQQGELKGLRDQVMHAGLPEAALKSIKQISQIGEQLREWDRKRIQLETMSGEQASAEQLSQAGLRDAILRLVMPVLTKVGLMGGTLGTSLESRKTMKRIEMQDSNAELTWREIMEGSIDYGEENASHQATSYLTQPEPPEGGAQGKGGKGGGHGGGKGGGGKGKGGNKAWSTTTDGTAAGVCLRHCIRTECDFPQCRDNPARAAGHPPARKGHGILPSECATWPPCPNSSCPFGLRCIYKHGDGKAQLESQHGNRSVQSHLANSPPPQISPAVPGPGPGVVPDGPTTAQYNELLTQVSASNQQIAALTAAVQGQQHRPSRTTPAELIPLLNAIPDACHAHATVMSSLLQVCASTLIGKEGRRATSYFTTRGEHLGQALDSGGSDHIAGQYDVEVAYAWNRLSEPIPVTTANGVVYATWECTVPTILGPMRCYYLENGGPPQSLLSVDKLCREGEYTYVHTKWGARIVHPNGNIENLIADGGLHYLPNATYDSHAYDSACDESSTKQERVAPAPPQSYISRATRHQQQPRLGSCDPDGFRQVLRGSKSIPRAVPRVWAHQSRYSSLQEEPENNKNKFSSPAAEIPTAFPPQMEPTPMEPHVSYGVQTRGMTKSKLPGKQALAELPVPSGDELLVHRREGHAQSHPGCFDCQMGKMQARKTPFRRPTATRTPTNAGFRIAGDLKGPLKPDINGHMWHLVLVDMDAKYGYIHSMSSKHSDGAKLGVQKFWADLKKKTGSDIGIRLFHSDDGKEFMGDLDEFLLDMGVTRTHTGGYAAKYNLIVEQRIKQLLGRMRANLHTALGENDYYDELAGVALRHANHLINVVPWTNDKCPHEALTGHSYVMDKADKVFGSLVIMYVKKELRRSATTPVATMGIYVGRADEVPGGIWVVPIGYDAGVNRWVLDKPIISVDYKMYEGFFPLRTQPKETGRTRTLDDFMESTQPWFHHESLGVDGQQEVPARSVTTGAGVYEVERILDRRKKKKSFEYQVQWKGYDAESNTWEPQRHLEDYGCRTLLSEFNTEYDKKHVTSNLCAARNDDPAGRTTRLLEDAQTTLEADAQDMVGYESSTSRKTRRRAWDIRNNLAKWHTESAAQWITSYATQLSPRSQSQPPERPTATTGSSSATSPVPFKYKDPVKQSTHAKTVASWCLPQAQEPSLRQQPEPLTQEHLRNPGSRVSQATCMETPVVHLDPDEPGGEVYETVKELMRVQNLVGDPTDFIPGYKKELETVTKMRLKEVSPAVAQYVRAKKLAVRLRMILEVKRDMRRKGRLVLQGFRAPSWWRVGSTDSPVVATAGLRALIFRRDKQAGVPEVLSQFDFDVAFLQANGFTVTEPTRHVSYRPHPGYPDRIYELTGPLYGSDDAPMRFFNTVAPWLIEMGFTQGKNDPCMFTNHTTGVQVGLHVDDGLVRGTQAASEAFYADLAVRFKYKPPKYLSKSTPLEFCGFVISESQDEQGKLVRTMDCTAEVEKLIKLAGVSIPHIRKVKCPMPDGSEIASDPTPLGKLESTFYRSTVGQIQYFAHIVRYDVAHAISRLGQYSQQPTEGAYKALTRVLGYLASTVNFQLKGYVGGGSDSIEIYCDSDHGGDKHLTTRSQSGIIITLNGVPVHWRSARQPVTALSSAEAEIYALAEAVKCGRLFNWRCEEMGMKVEWPLTILVDNTQAITFQKGTCVNSKLRGTFDMRREFVGELRNSQEIATKHISRDKNKADLLTHCQPSGPYNQSVQQLQDYYRQEKFGG